MKKLTRTRLSKAVTHVDIGVIGAYDLCKQVIPCVRQEQISQEQQLVNVITQSLELKVYEKDGELFIFDGFQSPFFDLNKIG